MVLFLKLSVNPAPWCGNLHVQGGAIYSLGAQGNMPFEMPWKFQNTSAIMPPSVQSRNWIHDSGDNETAALDHGGIGKD